MSFYYKIFTGFDRLSRRVYISYGVNIFKSKFKSTAMREILVCSFSQGKGIKINDFLPFEDMVEARRKQAQCSLVVQVHSENSCSELYDYCQSKSVNKMFYYMYNSNHFVLVEFRNPDGMKDLCSPDPNGQPTESPFVWFRAVKDKKKSSSKSFSELPLSSSNHHPTHEQINDWLAASQSLSDGMEVLFQSLKLSDLGIRLRMLCARQVEMALSGLFPHVKALPFGSTVNSFGKEGCDLDLTIQYGCFQNKLDHKRRLMHQSKSTGAITRGQTQRQMEFLGDMLQIYVPGVVGVKRILGARVPIIKYSHEYTGIDTDISITNLTAIYMSELLYLFGCLDPCLIRLGFTVKSWANAVGLTSNSPGRWITNFSLTLLCIFYLQVEKRLPSLDFLIQSARKEDERFADDVNCTFIRDLRLLDFDLNQSENQGSLLKGFFDYYQGFDFDNKAIDLCSGTVCSKPDYSPLYILNPLERSLNVSKNVSFDEMERFRIESRNAAWTLETKGSLRDLFDRAPHSHLNKKYVSRLVAVRDLF